MQTQELYYQDPYLRQFEARVIGCEAAKEGYLVTLSQTAFYPEGGGQACDTGTLDEVQVLDVQESEGKVLHLCDGPLPVGKLVRGQIHWQRRFDLMQQHTGEHIVSGLIYQYCGYHNTGFHVGAEVMEVDFDGCVDPQLLERIEEEANRAIWENIPLQTFTPDPEALTKVFYRTKRPLPWPVRIVQVPGYDSCACCGLHVARTGEVGLIKIISCVKFHGGIRLEMVCGERAYRYMAEIFRQNREVSRQFSAKLTETGEAARWAAAQLSEQKQTIAQLQKNRMALIAAGYAGRKNVVHFEEGLEPAQVRLLAESISKHCEGFAAVFSGKNYCLASQKEDMQSLGKALNAALQGKGGGKGGFFQGSVCAPQDAVEAFFRG